MELQVLEKDTWTIAAVIEGWDDQGEPMTFVDGLQSMREKDLDGLFAVLEKASSEQLGPKALGDGICHQVSLDNEAKIFQFTKGRLRLLWFYGKERKLIICCVLFLKSTKKTERPYVDKALNFLNEYEQAYARKSIVIFEP